MSEKIGRFEIISQIAHSSFSTVYKANDPEAQQTVALKVVRLDALADRAALEKAVFEEAEQAKSLSSHNIAGLYGVGDEGDFLLAAAEYVQGNPVATTLARHEGFSIWDLQDIARQVCQALDHAHGHGVVHRSLEPAKIMVQWDGLVKVLGFGISSMNATAASSNEAVPEAMHYFSPEQVRGETVDHRSGIFSLGAVLYEMATEQKAFAGNSVDEVRTAILESAPPLPHRLKGNVNPALSNLIMKALSKSPDERFQSGQELIKELEQCKSAGGLAAKQSTVAAAKAPPRQMPKANAAAAGFAGQPKTVTTTPAAAPPKPVASAAPAVEEEKPAFAVDPMMAGDAAPAAAGTSFSEISELPPLKEVRIVSTPSPAPEESEQVYEPLPAVALKQPEPEKPKVQVRAAAKKAANEIRKTPPKLYLYAIGGAVALIVLVIAGLALKNYWEDRDTSEPEKTVQQPAEQPKPAQKPAPVASAPQAPAETAAEEPAADSSASEPEAAQPEAVAPKGKRGRTRSAPAVVPAQVTVNSTPAGASIAFDGSVLCQSPCTLTGIAPGQHTISASKDGFSGANHTLSLSSGAHSTVTLQLNQLSAILSVASNPAGAAILIDGKDTGKLTPTQISLDKSGLHSVTLRRYGYLDATSSLNIQVGQTANVNLELAHLGNTDEIRAASGKFKKVFGHGDNSGMGIVSVKTQPKGAQIMVNNRVLDKNAPFDFYLNPGTYVLDITMAGYKPVHRVITVQEGERVAIEEALSTE